MIYTVELAKSDGQIAKGGERQRKLDPYSEDKQKDKPSSSSRRSSGRSQWGLDDGTSKPRDVNDDEESVYSLADSVETHTHPSTETPRKRPKSATPQRPLRTQHANWRVASTRTSRKSWQSWQAPKHTRTENRVVGGGEADGRSVTAVSASPILTMLPSSPPPVPPPKLPHSPPPQRQ